MKTTKESGKLTEYLLGGLGEEERQAIEEKCFTNDDFFLEVEAVEQDLIDRYVRGGLAGRELSRFQAAYLEHPERAQRVATARRLIAYVDERRPAAQVESWCARILAMLSGPALKPVAAAACLVLVVGALVFLRQAPQPQQQSRVIEAPQPEPSETQAVPQTAPAVVPSPPKAVSIPAFLLAPGLVRGENDTTVVTAGESTQIRLRLVLESVDYSRYKAVVETPEGEVVYSRTGLAPSSVGKVRMVVLTVPVANVQAGDYVVRLSDAEGGQSVAEYSFRKASR